MNKISRRGLIAGIGVVLAAALSGHGAWAKHCWDCRKPAIDMPVSLAKGLVQTQEFLGKHEAYLIMIRVQKHLPFAEMNCMLGLTIGPLDPNNCDKDPVLEANWIVRNEGKIVAQGSVHGKDGNGGWANKSIDRYLGHFSGEPQRKYVLEVKFTKDGSALNITDPHLIVMIVKPTDM